MLSTLENDELFATSDLRLSFFRPVLDGTIEFAAEVLHRGRRQAHVEVVFLNDRDKIVGKATATQVITPIGG
jgi:acyl-coenzyme A thioesterase PaaI-like protein